MSASMRCWPRSHRPPGCGRGERRDYLTWRYGFAPLGYRALDGRDAIRPRASPCSASGAGARRPRPPCARCWSREARRARPDTSAARSPRATGADYVVRLGRATPARRLPAAPPPGPDPHVARPRHQCHCGAGPRRLGALPRRRGAPLTTADRRLRLAKARLLDGLRRSGAAATGASGSCSRPRSSTTSPHPTARRSGCGAASAWRGTRAARGAPAVDAFDALHAAVAELDGPNPSVDGSSGSGVSIVLLGDGHVDSGESLAATAARAAAHDGRGRSHLLLARVERAHRRRRAGPARRRARRGAGRGRRRRAPRAPGPSAPARDPARRPHPSARRRRRRSSTTRPSSSRGGAGAPARISDEPVHVPGATAAALLVDRAAYEAVGGLPDSPDIDVAAFELCRRLRASGGRGAWRCRVRSCVDPRPVPDDLEPHPAGSRGVAGVGAARRRRGSGAHARGGTARARHAAHRDHGRGAQREGRAPLGRLASRPGVRGGAARERPRRAGADRRPCRRPRVDGRATCTASCAASHPCAAPGASATCCGSSVIPR